YADMQAFFARYYTPANMAILLSGDVDESVIPVLEREFAGFQRPAGDAPAPGELTPLHGRTQIDVPVPASEGVILGWPLVSATHPDRVALEVMDRLVLDGPSGIIERELLLPQKVATAGSSPTFLRDAGYFELYADALAGQRHDELERLLLDVVGKLSRGEFSDGELAAAILTADIEHQRALESNAGRLTMMERAFITGEDWHDAVQRVERMHQVTRDDITRVARRYLTGDFLVVRKVKGASKLPKITKPAITPVPVAGVRHGAFAREILDLPSDPIQPVALVPGRDYARATIATGPLISVGNSRNGLFSVRYEFDVGRTDDRFVCLALDVMKVAGAGARSADEVARAFHELGVVVTTSCTRARTAISVSGVDKNLEPALALVRAWLAEPVFDDATVKARVATVVTERANAVASPQSITAALEDFARYGQDTEFLVVPTSQQLQAVTAARLRTTLAAFLRWTHRTSYFGPRTPAAAAAAVMLGDGRRPTTPRKPVKLRTPNTTLVTDLPTAQTHIWLTWPRAPTTNPERAVGLVFGEYISPALFQDVREARGLAYTVFGGYGAGERTRDDAQLFAYVGTQGDKAHDAIDAVIDTLRQPLDEHRLALARDALAERYRVDRIAPRDVAAAVFRWEDQGEPSDPRAARHAAAQKVSRGALEAWMKSALGKPCIVSIVGDHRKLDDARLARLAPVTMVPVARLFGY
ncbi:MAG TPA: insulinase family protein, partial [Kofleriaceae bacterium]|nr:insulinase family protein [Kofleriaceae bacterium]